MRLQFLNRKKEITRLKKAIGSSEPVLVVVYGRRRCGKSTLLQHVVREKDVYYLADMRERSLQIRGLADEIARKIAGFNEVMYPSWEALFSTFNNRAVPNTTLLIDEFPYLVQISPELPSILQKLIDRGLQINIVLCGSSQRMMRGIVLDSTTPLYGRASEIIKIRPLEPGWIEEAFMKNGVHAVELFSVWGGVPHYWELANNFKSSHKALKEIIFERDGILHNEPQRLLLDDMRSAAQPHSILSVIANGCNRISEIAGRLGKQAVNLSRPLSTLIDLGYIERQIPFGENVKSTKRSLYKICDPFLLFWYRYIQPNQSLLEQNLVDEVYSVCEMSFSAHTGEIWEMLTRELTARIKIGGKTWKPARRWWGNGNNGKSMEIDTVAESFDGRHILLGEAKWKRDVNIKSLVNSLKQKAENFPCLKGRKPVFVLWLKDRGKYTIPDVKIIDAKMAMRVLK